MSSNREQTETADDVTPFRFFNLSAELRNRIYEYTFSGVEAKLPVADPRGDYSDKFSAAPSLLLTCKQIYTEGLTIYFSESAFYSESSRRMREWLEFIGSILRRQVSFVGYGPAIREPNTTRLSQARLGDDARDLVKLRKLMLNVIRRSHVITVEEIPEEKLHVRFVFPLLPGIATHWTNNPKDAATKFGERLAEIRKVPENVISLSPCHVRGGPCCIPLEWASTSPSTSTYSATMTEGTIELGGRIERLFTTFEKLH